MKESPAIIQQFPPGNGSTMNTVLAIARKTFDGVISTTFPNPVAAHLNNKNLQ